MDDLVVAKTVQTSPIRTLAEGLKSMLVEMSLVHGVGQSKLSRYGLRFLTALAEAGQSVQDWQKSA